MRSISLLTVLLLLLVQSCNQNPRPVNHSKNASESLTDSISGQLAGIYSNNFLDTSLMEVEHTTISRDSTITQVMKDPAGNTRQVTIIKNKRRIYFAQYYANGQLRASYAFDQYGQYNGAAEEYWENGLVKEAGYYRGGLREGEWRNYDSSGRFSGAVYYDKNGQPQATKD